MNTSACRILCLLSLIYLSLLSCNKKGSGHPITIYNYVVYQFTGPCSDELVPCNFIAHNIKQGSVTLATFPNSTLPAIAAIVPNAGTYSVFNSHRVGAHIITDTLYEFNTETGAMKKYTQAASISQWVNGILYARELGKYYSIVQRHSDSALLTAEVLFAGNYYFCNIIDTIIRGSRAAVNNCSISANATNRGFNFTYYNPDTDSTYYIGYTDRSGTNKIWTRSGRQIFIDPNWTIKILDSTSALNARLIAPDIKNDSGIVVNTHVNADFFSSYYLSNYYTFGIYTSAPGIDTTGILGYKSSSKIDFIWANNYSQSVTNIKGQMTQGIVPIERNLYFLPE